MNVLYPRFRPNLLPAMLGYALLGSLVAGLYGIIHDQITYSLSHGYFTRLKFAQFHYADFGSPPRCFVAEIGFLATWWVGFVAGWFLARLALPKWPAVEARACILRAFGIILACAFTASLVGFGLGFFRGPNADYSSWQEFATTRGVTDLPGFVRVAYIHNASYLGGLIGLIVGLVYLKRVKKDR